MKKFIFTTISICLLTINNSMGQGQWVSQNSGTNAMLESVFFVSSDTGYVCDENGYFYKTVNGGQNWNVLGQGPGSALFFLDALHGFGSNGPIIKTNNGGITWDTAYINPAFWVYSIYFPDHKHGYAGGLNISLNGILLKTIDSGITWDTVRSFPAFDYVSVFFTDSLTGYIGVTNFIYKTTDGGNTLIQSDTLDGDIYSISFPVHDIGFACTDLGNVYKTTDAGATWNKINYPFQPILYSIYFADVNHGCTVGGDGISTMSLYQTNNCGTNWHLGASGVQALISVFFPDTATGYAVGTDGIILKYTYSVSINENSFSGNNVSIYPNPGSDILSLTATGLTDEAIASVYDLQGQLLLQQPMHQSIEEINISSLSKGIYVLKVSGADGIAVKKFIKE